MEAAAVQNLPDTLENTLNTYHILLEQARSYNDRSIMRTLLAQMGRKDLFFLLTQILNRHDLEKPWLYERCREVQRNPDGYIDLWARDHYKSTIITFGLTIQDILNDPEITVCILSFNRPTAKAFLSQIKREFEQNDMLKWVYKDVLYGNPEKESPKWSEDEGLIIKRRKNPKEATLEAFGLVDGQPTGKHYTLIIYDDTVTDKSVGTPEMITKVTKAWELSLSLTSEFQDTKTRIIGTRYHHNDTYKTMLDRGAGIPRIYPATDDGTATGNPVLMSLEKMVKKRQKQGPYTFACQYLLNPTADDNQSFDPGWLLYWPAREYKNLNIYILCDPASKRKKTNDYTVFMVIGLGEDENYYVITMIRDRLNLVQRANTLFSLHRQYRPLAVGYEEYGMQADKEHYEYVMEKENYRFKITSLGGNMPKEDRIKKLIPIYDSGRMYLPETCVRRNYEGRQEDLSKIFVDEEYKQFPLMSHDDMMDCQARILEEDLKAKFPSKQEDGRPGRNLQRMMQTMKTGDWVR